MGLYREWLAVAAIVFSLSATAQAADTVLDVMPETLVNGWDGEAELGFVMTSGNTDTRSLNAKALISYNMDRHVTQASVEVLKASDSGVTTAERYLLAAKSKYYFQPLEYLFTSARYEDDRFSGYDYQTSLTAGYGRRVLEHESVYLDMEGGAGARRRAPVAGTAKTEGIVRGAGFFLWQISPTSKFTQDLLVESGADNTYSEAVTALSVKINSSLAMKTSLSVRHNSQVPAGTEKTDTITAVNLVYDF